MKHIMSIEHLIATVQIGRYVYRAKQGVIQGTALASNMLKIY